MSCIYAAFRQESAGSRKYRHFRLRSTLFLTWPRIRQCLVSSNGVSRVPPAPERRTSKRPKRLWVSKNIKQRRENCLRARVTDATCKMVSRYKRVTRPERGVTSYSLLPSLNTVLHTPEPRFAGETNSIPLCVPRHPRHPTAD